MSLSARARERRSAGPRTGTRVEKSPASMRCAPSISAPTGATSRRSTRNASSTTTAPSASAVTASAVESGAELTTRKRLSTSQTTPTIALSTTRSANPRNIRPAERCGVRGAASSPLGDDHGCPSGHQGSRPSGGPPLHRGPDLFTPARRPAGSRRRTRSGGGAELEGRARSCDGCSSRAHRWPARTNSMATPCTASSS